METTTTTVAATGSAPAPAPACEVARLPEELLSAALALTTPRDACRAAAASRDFHAAAGSDAVWSRFLPRDLPPLADGELSGGPAAPPSDKARFLRLCGRPVLLADGLTVLRTTVPINSSSRDLVF
jgi:hypothetical protein